MTPPVDIAILARAPVAGAAKTRLIPVLGAPAAARLHRQLVLRTLATAHAARLGGRVTLWGTPAPDHRFFRALATLGQHCVAQPEGDLGARMRHALAGAASRPTLLIGTDCPALRPAHLAAAAQALREGQDAVLLPAEDGGYVLIGLRAAPPQALFEHLPWGGDQVMALTRQRLRQLGYRWAEPCTLWDVDRPEDLPRLKTLVPPLRPPRPMSATRA